MSLDLTRPAGEADSSSLSDGSSSSSSLTAAANSSGDLSPPATASTAATSTITNTTTTTTSCFNDATTDAIMTDESSVTTVGVDPPQETPQGDVTDQSPDTASEIVVWTKEMEMDLGDGLNQPDAQETPVMQQDLIMR